MTPRKRLILWTVIGAMLLVARGPDFLNAFRPPPRFVGDFVQDWASGREFQAGGFVYGDTRAAFSRATNTPEAENQQVLPRNAHPPGAILATLPFARLDHRDAHFAWNLATFPLFAIGVFSLTREFLGARWKFWLIPDLGAAAFCYPLVLQLQLANFSCLLGALLIGAFLAERRGYGVAAGLFAGAAAAMKLVPGLLLAYYLLSRQWRNAIAMLIAIAMINGAALALFGVEAFRTYAIDTVPVVERENLSSWLNASMPGFFMRMFAPHEAHRILPLVHSPELGRTLAAASQLAALLAVAWASFRGPRDRAFALTCAAMLLIGPLTWPHSSLMLAVPIAFVAANTAPGPRRTALLACLAVMWMPANYAAQLLIGPERAALMNRDAHRALTPVENLLATTPATLALLGIFVLGLRSPHNPQPHGRTESSAPIAPPAGSDPSDTPTV